MARKNRAGMARQAFARQQAQLRRRAPGKRFVGEGAGQRQAARRAEVEAVERMADDAALRRADEVGEPVSAILAELVQDAARLARSLVTAPFCIALAPRQSRQGA